MSNSIITKILAEKQKEVENYINNVFPRKAGKEAVDFIHSNFDREGYQDGSLDKWASPKRKRKKGKAATQYKTLHSGRNSLRNSFRYDVETAKAIIRTDVEYAAIHNEGGEITHPISRRQRVKAYETHVKKTGSRHREQNSMWKGLALTKRTSYAVKMPRRQFIGPSTDLGNKLRDMAEKDLKRILNQ